MKNISHLLLSYPGLSAHRIGQRRVDRHGRKQSSDGIPAGPPGSAPTLRQRALSVSQEEQERAEEVRLRVGRPLSLVLPWGERWLEGNPVTGRDLEQLVELASGASFHAVADQVRRGYLTVAGGHRIGLCGSAVLREGEVQGLRNPLLRRPAYCPAAARSGGGGAGTAVPGGAAGEYPHSGPAGLGKTTLLRDLIRRCPRGRAVILCGWPLPTSGERWRLCTGASLSWRWVPAPM